MTPYTLHLIDRDIVARTCYAEARGEGEKGMRAVCHVIRNRVNDKRWPRTYAQVCLAPRAFSCWGEDPNFFTAVGATLENATYKLAYAIACDVLAGESEDLTLGANHFFGTNIELPYWANEDKYTVTIYHHKFYRL